MKGWVENRVSTFEYDHIAYIDYYIYNLNDRLYIIYLKIYITMERCETLICSNCQVMFSCEYFIKNYRQILEDKYWDDAEYEFNRAYEIYQQNHPNS
jgi:hypothetical protein